MGQSIREMQNKLTENHICNAFLELLKAKEFEKISVADICRTANISRGTFYVHYRDINALIDFINSWYVEALAPLVCRAFEEPYSEEGSLSILTDIISLLSSWPEYAETILGHEKGQEVIERVTELVQEKYLCAIMEKSPDADLKDAMYRFTFIFYGGWGVFRKWCLDGLKDSPEYLFQHLKKLL